MSEPAASLWTAWTGRRDQSAFEALVLPELPHAIGFARRLGCSAVDAEDALQDALVRLAVVRDDTPVEMGLRTWLCREVRVRARSRLRSERRRRSRQIAASVSEGCESAVPRVALCEEVEQALAALDGDEREAVALRYLHDLEYRDIALVLGIAEGACRQRVHRGIERLRGRLGRNAAALVAALPLPPVPASGALVQAALSSSASISAAVIGGLLMASTGAKVALVAVLLAAVGAGALLWRTEPDASTTASDVEGASLGDHLADGRVSAGGTGETLGRSQLAGRGLNGRRIARVGKGEIVGRVLDVRTTKGVAKAAVTLAGTGLADETVAVRTETAADGSFRLSDAAAGLDFTLRVEATGLASLEQRGLVVRADGVVDLGDLWLGLPGTLEGFVLDPAGEGVVGVEVQLHRGMGSLREFLQSGGFTDLFVNMDREPEPLARATTKAKGAFRFEDAGAGPAALIVRAPGYKQSIVSLTLTSDAGHEPVQVRLAPGTTLAGKVVDAAGEGLAGVHLAAFKEGEGMPSPLSRTFTRSAADGTFRFTSLAGEGRLMVVGAAPGYPDAFTHGNAGDADVRVVMRRGATLEVQIVSDLGGGPIVGAQVLIAVGEKISLDDGPGSLVGGLTDASGSTVLEVFPGELQMAIVNAPGFPPNYWDGAGRSAASGHGLKGPADARVPQGRTTVTFRLPTGVKLRGRVTDMEGGPLAGVEVTSLGFLGNGDRTTSGVDGTYELDVITAEFSMGVTARLPGWVQDEIRSPIDDRENPRVGAAIETTLDIRMRRAIALAGRVLDPEGRPVAGATVTVRREKKDDRFVFDPATQRLGRNLTGHSSSITRADGTYELDGAPSEGRVRVFARREGFVDGWTEAFQVGTELAKAPDVRLLAGANLDVRVLGPSGQGVGGARVRVEVERVDRMEADDWESVMERESRNADHRTGATGAVGLTLLPPGKVTLRVMAQGFAPSGAHVTIGPEGGPKEPVTIRLQQGITVSGRVLDRDGHPVEGALVCVARSGTLPSEPVGESAEEEDWIADWDRSRRATTDALGHWSVKDLPDKRFNVYVDKDGYDGALVPLQARTPVEVRLVKLDPEAARRIAEIDKELQVLYGRMTVEGETPAIIEKLEDLREQRQRLYSEGR